MDSPIVEVAIALTFIFASFALIVSGVNELIASTFQLLAAKLKSWIGSVMGKFEASCIPP